MKVVTQQLVTLCYCPDWPERPAGSAKGPKIGESTCWQQRRSSDINLLNPKCAAVRLPNPEIRMLTKYLRVVGPRDNRCDGICEFVKRLISEGAYLAQVGNWDAYEYGTPYGSHHPKSPDMQKWRPFSTIKCHVNSERGGGILRGRSTPQRTLTTQRRLLNSVT
jgi:hypothetical protein